MRCTAEMQGHASGTLQIRAQVRSSSRARGCSYSSGFMAVDCGLLASQDCGILLVAPRIPRGSQTPLTCLQQHLEELSRLGELQRRFRKLLLLLCLQVQGLGRRGGFRWPPSRCVAPSAKLTNWLDKSCMCRAVGRRRAALGPVRL